MTEVTGNIDWKTYYSKKLFERFDEVKDSMPIETLQDLENYIDTKIFQGSADDYDKQNKELIHNFLLEQG